MPGLGLFPIHIGTLQLLLSASKVWCIHPSGVYNSMSFESADSALDRITLTPAQYCLTSCSTLLIWLCMSNFWRRGDLAFLAPVPVMACAGCAGRRGPADRRGRAGPAERGRHAGPRPPGQPRTSIPLVLKSVGLLYIICAVFFCVYVLWCFSAPPAWSPVHAAEGRPTNPARCSPAWHCW